MIQTKSTTLHELFSLQIGVCWWRWQKENVPFHVKLIKLAKFKTHFLVTMVLDLIPTKRVCNIVRKSSHFPEKDACLANIPNNRNESQSVTLTDNEMPTWFITHRLSGLVIAVTYSHFVSCNTLLEKHFKKMYTITCIEFLNDSW